ncbi:Uncharacterised protein [Shigella sonnei]|nr:Uncharacterised protein [Shigella sonnei]
MQASTSASGAPGFSAIHALALCKIARRPWGLFSTSSANAITPSLVEKSA